MDVTLALGAWRNRWSARGDYQQAAGRTTIERLSLSYQPRRELARRRPGGQPRRSEGRPGFGPAFRVTQNNAGQEQSATAARGSLNLHWLLTARLMLSEECAVYADRGEATAKSVTGFALVPAVQLPGAGEAPANAWGRSRPDAFP